jgi:hypothetical protein
MDEMNLRTMLGELAETPAPPARIDVNRAMRRGRRHRRLRRAGVGSSIMTIAVAAATASLVAVPRSHATPSRPANQQVLVAPDHFNPLVPYASFGWLPAGFSAHGPYTGGSSNAISVSPDAELGATANGIVLVVYARGACTESMPGSLPGLTCSKYLSTLNGSIYGPISAISHAPSINGRPAFWAHSYRERELLWEYAPDAWAVLIAHFVRERSLALQAKQAAAITAMPRIAASIKYGNTTPIRFPFWITGEQRQGTIQDADYGYSDGLLIGTRIGLREDLGPDGISMSAMVSDRSNSRVCIMTEGAVRQPLDGTTGIWTPALGIGSRHVFHDYQEFCDDNVDGLVLEIGTAAVPSSAYSIAKDTHLLGPDPANWTTIPVR